MSSVTNENGSNNSTCISDNNNTSNPLQALNYANVIAYVSNFLVVFGSSVAGLPDNATLSNRYQTLVTPAPFAFSIWGIIFLAELIWTIAQCFPKYRSSELVVKGVGYNYVFACIGQCLWTVLFGLEKMSLSLIAMISILLPLLLILDKISNISATTTEEEVNTATTRYWLLKFPFEMHASWIMAATLVNINVDFVAYNASPKLQTIVGWMSLAIIFCVGFGFTLLKTKKQYVVPCVLVWASLAIGSELSNPRDQILSTFSVDTIHQTKLASALIAAVLLLVVVVDIIRNRLLKPTESSDDNGAAYSSLQ